MGPFDSFNCCREALSRRRTWWGGWKGGGQRVQGQVQYKAWYKGLLRQCWPFTQYWTQFSLSNSILDKYYAAHTVAVISRLINIWHVIDSRLFKIIYKWIIDLFINIFTKYLWFCVIIQIEIIIRWLFNLIIWDVGMLSYHLMSWIEDIRYIAKNWDNMWIFN